MDKKMSENPPIQSTIESYRKRRNRFLPLLIRAAAVLLVLGGITVLVLSLSGGGKITLFATKTPTPTITPSPTNTVPPTATATITSTPTQTTTPTPSAPFYYIIQENDYLSTIAEKFNLGENGVILILMLNPAIDPVTQTIFAGTEILIPPPGWPIPTMTPWPQDAPHGTKINYFVMPGDSLGVIAARFLSTIEEIGKANPDVLTDVNSPIYPGQILIVPVNLVTPVPSRTVTLTPTSTPKP
jgi:LysM repeat protein